MEGLDIRRDVGEGGRQHGRYRGRCVGGRFIRAWAHGTGVVEKPFWELVVQEAV